LIERYVLPSANFIRSIGVIRGSDPDSKHCNYGEAERLFTQNSLRTVSNVLLELSDPPERSPLTSDFRQTTPLRRNGDAQRLAHLWATDQVPRITRMSTDSERK